MPTLLPNLTEAVKGYYDLRRQLVNIFPELAEDERALHDTLEGISALDDQIIMVMRHVVEREAEAAALADIIEKMITRKKRKLDGAARLRAIVLNTMQEVNMPKISAPDLTLTVAKGRPAVVIADDAILPDEFWRVKREPDKNAIGAALKEGRDVPGAQFGNASPILTVRRD